MAMCTQMCPKRPHLRFARGSTPISPSAHMSIFVHLSIFVTFRSFLDHFAKGSVLHVATLPAVGLLRHALTDLRAVSGS